MPYQEQARILQNLYEKRKEAEETYLTYGIYFSRPKMKEFYKRLENLDSLYYDVAAIFRMENDKNKMPF